jgi:parvulin-like peptidyl-prolyl isomerase
MNPKMHKNIAMVLAFVLLLAACGKDSTPLPATLPVTLTLSTGTSVASTNTPLPPSPSPSPVPLAASVNGEPITIADFQTQMTLALAGLAETGTNLATEETADTETRVINRLIDELLLAQSARQAGFTLDEAGLQQRIDKLAEQAGGQQALDTWMANNGFSLEGFRAAILRAAEAAWMRDQIAGEVLETAEQIHARQILLYNQTEAEQVLAQLQNGADFEELAFGYDPVTGGDLGWFPRGYLLQSAVEEAVFLLQPGQVTGVIQTQIGFHIVQVIERDPQHLLDPDARLTLKKEAVQLWLDERRSQSDIQIFGPEP